jgi:hypothetical protein
VYVCVCERERVCVCERASQCARGGLYGPQVATLDLQGLTLLFSSCPPVLPLLLADEPSLLLTWRSATHCRGRYSGPEEPRLAALKLAADLGAAYVDVELKAAGPFFAGGGPR